ncbi:hypothetical protein [Kaistella antarctica]|uniref:Uncharacterized protein n=1 Tax=Kaistella antarctica TaxID=266748 RepID=A0A448NSX0_9FLAO|nr:hypothetical protein [Kaistella antarctica]KEY17960.1 hypothetical protein HY04_05375 [Kaistella antarctica]SEV81646.1 hypothetical protein SAMN05421765_0275 [Kaistella antarctica]VEI00390.1 Uncharacterised protein [Kaistella antarctica]
MKKEQILDELAKANPSLAGLDNLINFSKVDPPVIEESNVYYPKRNDFFFFVPENLNLDELLEKASANNLHPFKVIRFLSLIGQRSIHKRRNFNGSGFDFYSKSHARIRAKSLEVEVGKDYLIYYRFLKEEYVINRTPYKKGGKSFGYGFLPHFRYQRLSVKIFSANKLIQKIASRFKDKSTEKYCKNLIKPFRRESFGIDYEKAEKSLHKKYCESFIQNSFGGYMLDDEFKSVHKYGAYHNSLIQMMNLLNGKFYFNRSNFTFVEYKEKSFRSRRVSGRKIRNVKNIINIKRKTPIIKPLGRFYSTFSFLPKTVRDLLHFDGEKLEQIDVKNCVMYILSNYLKSNYSFSHHMLSNLTSKKYFALYSYNLTKQCLAEQGIDLVLEDFRDIQLPLTQFSISDGCNLSNPFPLTDFNSLLFQLGFVPENSSQKESLPKLNTIKAYQSLVPKLLPSIKPTEINIGSNSLERNSILNLGSEVFSGEVSEYSIKDQSSRLRKLKFTKAPTLDLSSDVTKLSNEALKRKNIEPTLGYCLSLSYMIPETLQSLLDKELERFQRLAVGGKFYESFIDDYKKHFSNEEWKEKYEKRINETYNGDASEDRKLTKEMLMSLIYARNENTNYNEIKWTFVKHFPLVYVLIDDLKTANHKQFSHALFNLEAEVMLDEIASKLLKNKIQCLTVHDCIAVKKSDVPKTLKIMSESFLTKFGIEPQIEFETSTKNNQKI